jgi:hypothetical protein
MKVIIKFVVCTLFIFTSIYAYSQNFKYNLTIPVIQLENDVSLDADEIISLDSLMNMTALGIIDSTIIPAAKL